MDKVNVCRWSSIGFVSLLIILYYTMVDQNFSFNSKNSLNNRKGGKDIKEHSSKDSERLGSDIKSQGEHWLGSPDNIQNKTDNKDLVPIIVIGILSHSNNSCLRDTQRALFIKGAKAYHQLDVKVFFLIDLPSPKLNKEQSIHNDIVYLNSTEPGIAKKLYLWYRYTVDQFPEAVLIGRMDDDIFVCTPQIFDRLNEVKHPRLYYGYSLGGNQIDDMFLFIGKELARRIAKRKMCNYRRTGDCLEDGNAVGRLKEWLSIYSDVVYFDESKSGKMVFYIARNRGGIVRMQEMYSYVKHDFCKQYILFHKAAPMHMYELNKNNEKLLNDSSRWKVSAQEIQIMKSCHVSFMAAQKKKYKQ